MSLVETLSEDGCVDGWIEWMGSDTDEGCV